MCSLFEIWVLKDVCCVLDARKEELFRDGHITRNKESASCSLECTVVQVSTRNNICPPPLMLVRLCVQPPKTT
jgi:hypothetical protein